MSTSENVEIVEENCKNTTIVSSGNVGPNLGDSSKTGPTSSKPPLEDSSKKRPRPHGSSKLTSEVWEHFENKIENGKMVGVCNYCNKVFKAGGINGTTALKNHLGTCSSKESTSIVECFEKQKQISVEKKNDGKVRFGNFTFDQDASRHELACAIILHEYPISIVDHVGFRKFISSLQPLFKMVSRNTIKEDILKNYNSEKAKLMDVFEKVRSRIAITTDMWTSNQKKGSNSSVDSTSTFVVEEEE